MHDLTEQVSAAVSVLQEQFLCRRSLDWCLPREDNLFVPRIKAPGLPVSARAARIQSLHSVRTRLDSPSWVLIRPRLAGLHPPTTHPPYLKPESQEGSNFGCRTHFTFGAEKPSRARDLTLKEPKSGLFGYFRHVFNAKRSPEDILLSSIPAAL